MSTQQPVCMGCLVQPNFLFHTPCHRCDHEPKYHFTPMSPYRGLTDEEKSVLNDLKEAWQKFTALGNHIEHDLTEFNYAIHLAQQKLALRVARRVNPDVWNQPKGDHEG